MALQKKGMEIATFLPIAAGLLPSTGAILE
jgi:hypothetical protein